MSNTPSPLRYPGGKTRLYLYVKELLQANNSIGQTYIEPFAGGAGLALKLLLNGDVKKIIINDFDYAIYCFWYCVLNYADELCNFIREVNVTPAEWEKQKNIYNNQKEYDVLDIGKATFFLNRTNVSGVIKGGMIGGQNQTGNYLIDARFNKENLIERIAEITKHKNNIDLYNRDAVDFLKNILPHYYKVFINFDPPYVEKGGQLYKNSFIEKDHEALRDAIRKCSRKWIVTYDVCDLTKNLYSKYRSSYIDINYSVKTNRKAKEYIFFSKSMLIPKDIKINSED